MEIFGCRDRTPERIGLQLETPSDVMPLLELRDGSLASSSGHRSRYQDQGRLYGPHVQGNGGYPAPTDRFVCVVAEQCIVADALTKVVMAEGAQSRDVLRHFGASAHWHDPGAG